MLVKFCEVVVRFYSFEFLKILKVGGQLWVGHGEGGAQNNVQCEYNDDFLYCWHLTLSFKDVIKSSSWVGHHVDKVSWGCNA